MIDVVRLVAALATLHPAPDLQYRRGAALDVAAAVASVIDRDHPIFGAPELDAAVMLRMAWGESRFRVDAVGDGGHSLGVWQLGGVSRRQAFDILESTRIAYTRLRASAEGCAVAPLAIYASGSCSNRRGREISAERMAEARAIVDLASWP